eukprot:2806492-Amphidinium_carterae.1
MADLIHAKPELAAFIVIHFFVVVSYGDSNYTEYILGGTKISSLSSHFLVNGDFVLVDLNIRPALVRSGVRVVELLRLLTHTEAASSSDTALADLNQCNHT